MFYITFLRDVSIQRLLLRRSGSPNYLCVFDYEKTLSQLFVFRKPALWYRVELRRKNNSDKEYIKKFSKMLYVFSQQSVFPPLVWQNSGIILCFLLLRHVILIIQFLVIIICNLIYDNNINNKKMALSQQTTDL